MACQVGGRVSQVGVIVPNGKAHGEIVSILGVEPPVTVVLAREIAPPDEGNPIEWLLLTTLPVTTGDDAARIVTDGELNADILR